MSQEILVSVVIPTYRPGAYIVDCLNSIVQQSLDMKVFEVIVVHNGVTPESTISLESILSSYASLNLKLVEVNESGVSNARNLGIDESQGKYILFLDDDDLISPTYLADMLSLARENSVVVSNVMGYNESQDLYENDYLSFNKDIKFVNFFVNRRFVSNSCCKLIPKAIIGSSRFRENIDIGEDGLFMFSLTKRISRLEFSDTTTIYYRRIRKGSATRRKIPLLKYLQNRLTLMFFYIVTFLEAPFKYNFFLFASRFIAILK